MVTLSFGGSPIITLAILLSFQLSYTDEHGGPILLMVLQTKFCLAKYYIIQMTMVYLCGQAVLSIFWVGST
jgi:hypothetical protein